MTDPAGATRYWVSGKLYEEASFAGLNDAWRDRTFTSVVLASSYDAVVKRVAFAEAVMHELIDGVDEAWAETIRGENALRQARAWLANEPKGEGV